MRSLKAILAGSVFIVVVILLLQLAYIFVAVGYNALAVDYPFLNDIVGWVRYLVGIPVFIVVMFVGGYITASIADLNDSVYVLLHCLVVGAITVGSMMYSAMENASLTIAGVVVTSMALTATSAGGLYWLRKN